MNANQTLSFAGTGKTYVAAQISAAAYGEVHIQVVGPEGNREYGFAADFNIDPQIAAWIAAQKGNRFSMATGTAKYQFAQLSLRGQTIHVQVAGDGDYKAFNVESSALAKYLGGILNAPAFEEEIDPDDEEDDDDNPCGG